jgi:hypothetical protein
MRHGILLLHNFHDPGATEMPPAMRNSIGKIFVRMLVVVAIVTLSVAGVTADEKPGPSPGYYPLSRDPDIVTDNLPHATFASSDAQLDEALKVLQGEIQKDPTPVPKAPPYPNKAFKYDQ